MALVVSFVALFVASFALGVGFGVVCSTIVQQREARRAWAAGVAPWVCRE